ncbi:MAG: M48 family metallopeptidase [Acidobacteriota bacterium]
MGSFSGDIDPIGVPLLYRLALVLVTAIMVLLPLIYVALVVLTSYGVYYHGVHNLLLFEIIESRRTALISYVTPLFAGITLVFFMIKPLLAPRGDKQTPRSLMPKDEPILFAFVQRVCDAVGAPFPKRIDVDCDANASASFRRGLASLGSQDLVLTLGLPLVRQSSLQQLTGVLAHELGHFAQGAGMGLSFVVRSINAWLSRVVYERDRWDEYLEKSVRDAARISFVASLVVQMARLVVWSTRRILWLLMWIGHGVSCFLLRQMEFDADRYEARMVGPETFETTCRELSYLGLAVEKSFGDLSSSWEEGRLVDNLPSLVAAHRRRIEPSVLRRIDADVDGRRTGWFDTHPAVSERIAYAHRETTTHVFQSDLPATALFRDFEALAVEVSRSFYEHHLDQKIRPEDLVDTDRLLARQDRDEAERFARNRFFLGATDHPLRPLPVGDVEGSNAGEGSDFGRLLNRLQVLRDELQEGEAEGRETLEAYDVEMGQRSALDRADDLLEAGFKVSAEELDVERFDTVSLVAKMETVQRRMDHLGGRLAPQERRAAERLLTALRVLELPGLGDRSSDLGALRDEVPRLLTAARAYASDLDRIDRLRRHFDRYDSIAEERQGSPNDEDLQRIFVGLAEEVREGLNHLRLSWNDLPYPFDHTDRGITLGRWAIPDIPPEDDYGGIHGAAHTALQRSFDLNGRVLARLAAIGERLEGELALDPLVPSEGPGSEA